LPKTKHTAQDAIEPLGDIYYSSIAAKMSTPVRQPIFGGPRGTKGGKQHKGGHHGTILQNAWCTGQGAGCRVQGAGCRVQGAPRLSCSVVRARRSALTCGMTVGTSIIIFSRFRLQVGTLRHLMAQP